MGRKIHPMMVGELKSRLVNVDEFVCIDLTGVTASETDALRKEVGGAGGSVSVVKNSVAQRVLDDLEKENASCVIDGPSTLAWGDGETIVSVCKILDEWKTKTRRLGIRGGWMQGRVLSEKDVKALATIPPREQLEAMMVRGFAAPIAGLSGVLQGLMRGLAIVLKGIAERRNSDG